MTKAVAIPYIIALVIGIIVVALLVYLVYKAVTNPAISVAECRAKVTDWCNTCKISNWSPNIPITDEIKSCGNLVEGCCWGDNSDCATGVTTGTDNDKLNSIKADCSATVGVT